MIRPGRNAKIAAATFLGANAALFAVASPAQAVTCYAKGSYSFINNRQSIDIYSGTRCNTHLGYVMVYLAGGRNIRLYAVDKRCDNIGFQARVHGHHVSSTGCNTSAEKVVNYDTVGSPKHMWAYVAGSTNSNVINLPTP